MATWALLGLRILRFALKNTVVTEAARRALYQGTRLLSRRLAGHVRAHKNRVPVGS